MIKFSKLALASTAFFLGCSSTPTQPTVNMYSQTKYDGRTKLFASETRYCSAADNSCYVEMCDGSHPPQCTAESGDSALKAQYFENIRREEDDLTRQVNELTQICKAEGHDRCVEEFQSRSDMVKKKSHALICQQPGVICRKREVPGNMPEDQWDLLAENQVLLARSVSRITQKNKDKELTKDIVILDEVLTTAPAK